MPKIAAYQARPDEIGHFKRLERELGLDITYVSRELNEESAIEAQGMDAVTVLGSNRVDRAAFAALSKVGVKYLAVRSAGYNYIDIDGARQHGIRFSNVSYSPNSVADFATMLILMCERKAKAIMARSGVQDYTLAGLQGRELRNLTVGIVGTGQIGTAVARNLKGFGCKILGFDVYENDTLKNLIEYVPLDRLIEESDVITLHAPLFDNNRHMINRSSIERMKDGVCIINCARGELIDSEALINGLESGKIGSAGLDVIENELGIFQGDHRSSILKHRQLSILKSFPNVIVTPHTAFYTDQAVSDMVENALKSLVSFKKNGTSLWEIKG